MSDFPLNGGHNLLKHFLQNFARSLQIAVITANYQLSTGFHKATVNDGNITEVPENSYKISVEWL